MSLSLSLTRKRLARVLCRKGWVYLQRGRHRGWRLVGGLWRRLAGLLRLLLLLWRGVGGILGLVGLGLLWEGGDGVVGILGVGGGGVGVAGLVLLDGGVA